MTLSRREQREIALQALFQLELNPEQTIELSLEQALESDEKDAEEAKDLSFARTLIEGVLSKVQDIDNLIVPHLGAKWSLNRISKIDLIILRIATFEILFGDLHGVPKTVAINEGIELAKRYSDDSSRAFVNAVLSKVANG